MVLVTFFLTTACSPSTDTQHLEAGDRDVQPERVNTSSEEQDGEAQGEVPAQGAEVAFKKQYPNAEKVSWDLDTNGYHEASFTMDGEKYRADYTAQGKWIETESSLKFGKLPKAVQDVITAQHDKDDITEIERVDHASKGVFYDVEFKQKGKNRDIEIREDGEIIKQ